MAAFSPRELELREGWRGYFASVSIAQRENRKLQASHMPKKYWRFLPEMAAAPAAAEPAAAPAPAPDSAAPMADSGSRA